MNQLPSIPQYIRGGKNDLCYAHLLGHCQHGHECNFIHVHKNDVQAPFINSVLTMEKQGIEWLTRNNQGAPQQGGGGRQ